ncbi:hypothetical protein B0T24DRAFT_572789 [Lasiosphaeria ovina]|uniref:DUF6603 domain-containing protein n=1 Tax=Lasiosphaeria ovina TaxID=92902 RepID=A0AAE0KHP2_9PEZI|nr:hypothetical protein B0T24DRAFT_572789 [Lasiosphaeria ovina]
MTLSYLDCQVDSYFINVGAGDAAVHLLVRDDVVRRAVLIDGGHTEGYDATHASIPELRKRYDNGVPFKLDAIVITHWDGDHYRSLTQVLYDDFMGSEDKKSTLIEPSATFYCPYTAIYKLRNTNWKIDNGKLLFKLRGKGKKQPAQTFEICNAVIGTPCMGHDLFSGTPLFNPTPTQAWAPVTSLNHVYENCDLIRNNERPVFLVVGADQHFISDAMFTNYDVAPEHPGKGSERLINGASIMAVVIWPTTTKTHVKPFLRVSLYTGGDAEEDRERVLLAWMENNATAPGGVKLDVVKTGHHGSHFAMPENMVNFQNKAFVISAGAKHGHPSRDAGFAAPTILATQQPYWIEKKSEYVSLKDFNIQTVISYKDGTAVLFEALRAELEKLKRLQNITITPDQARQELVDLLATSLGEAMEEMVAVNHIKFGGTLPVQSGDKGLLELYEPPATWQPPDAQDKDADSRYWKAVDVARATMRTSWSAHSCQPETAGPKLVQFVWLQATAEDVKLEVVKSSLITKNPQITPIKQKKGKKEKKGKSKKKGAKRRDPYDSDSDGNGQLGSKKFKKLTLWNQGFESSQVVDKSTTPDRDLELWTMALFTDDIKKALPTTRTFQRSALPTETSDIASWVDDCFPMADTRVLISGKTDTSGEIKMDAVEIELNSRAKGASGSDNLQASLLAFTTEQTMRDSQFGQDAAATLQTPLGYDKRLQGMLFALDSTRTSGKMSLLQLADLVGYNLPPFVAGILGLIKLRATAASSDHRSGLWFVPCHNWRFILRLAMEVDMEATSGMTAIGDFLKSSGLGDKVHVSDVLFTGTRVAEAVLETHVQTKSTIGLQATLILDTETTVDKTEVVPPSSLKGLSLTAGIKFGDGGFEVTLQMNNSTDDIFAQLLHWGESLISKESGGPQPPPPDAKKKDGIVEQIKNALGNLTKGFDLRSIVVGFRSKSIDSMMPSMPRPAYFTVNIEVSLPLPNKQQRVPFLVRLRWNQGVYSISSELWHESFSATDIPPTLRPYQALGSVWAMEPRAPNRVDSLSIKDLIGEPDLVFPAGIPDTISDARFKVSFGGGLTTISFEAAVESQPLAADAAEATDKGNAPPVLRFQELRLDLSMTFGGGSPEFVVEFDAVTEIALPPAFKMDPAQAAQVDDVIAFSTRIEYARENGDSSWLISGKLVNIKVANLYALFASDGSSDAIMDVMAGIHITYVWLSYEYNKDLPGRFDLDGKLRLGSLKDGVELDLQFSHVAKKKRSQTPGDADNSGWSFHASLHEVKNEDVAKGQEKMFSIAALLQGLVEDVNDLPKIVHSMQIPRSALTIALACSSVETGTRAGQQRHVVFALTITIKTSIGNFEVTLAQVRSYGSKSGATPGPSKESAGPGRLLRFSLSKLKALPTIPVVGTVAPPFDQVGVVWMNRDISPAEVEVLNHQVFGDQPLLMNATPDKPNLQKGYHFQVALLEGAKPTLILDHVVGGGGKKEYKVKGKATVAGTSADATTNASPGNTGKSVAPMAKTFGPLSVRNIGLSVEGDKFSIIRLSVDATVKIGPIAFALLGFTLKMDLSKLSRPEDLAALVPSVEVEGIAVSFEQPPTRLAGSFRRFDNEKSKGFQGAIAASIAAWSALAGGQYEELYPDFAVKSFFVFGMLQGPIAEFGCAEINGLTGGFGYNSRLRLPVDASEVTAFPFVALNRAEAGGSVLEQMNVVLSAGTSELISPVKGEMWFVAGLGLKAFQTVDAQAVFALTLGAEPKFAVLATAMAVFPKVPKGVGGGSPDNPFPHAFLVVDIAVSCVIDPFHGTVIVTGELTPLSFVLHPSCRLTGSFAIAYFLPNSEHAGDFMFSVGGFHPHFAVPSHYPTPRSRVGIAWQYDAELSISGAAYFAVTPSAAMGGGRLDMVVNKRMLGGRLSIRILFSAYADFLMQFHPFSYEANVAVTLFATAALNLVLWTEHFGPMEFSATLSLRGPPLAGEAKLHLWRWNIEVVFGQAPAKPKALTLDQFVRMVKNLPLDTPPRESSPVPDHLVDVTGGRAPADGAEASRSPVEVFGAGMRVEVQTRVPVLKARISGNTEQPRASTVKDRQGQILTTRLFARPMQLTQEFGASELVITLKGERGGEVPLNAQPVVKGVPPALWGECEYSLFFKPDLSAPMIPHTMGYILTVRQKEPSPENLPAINLDEFNSVDVRGEPGHDIPPIPPVARLENNGWLLSMVDMVARTKGDVWEKRKRRQRKRDAVAAWDLFKSMCSGGGVGRESKPPRIFESARALTAR